MQLEIRSKDPAASHGAPIPPRCEVHLLSAGATERHLEGDTLVMGWDLALLLQELLEDDGEREDALRALLPGYVVDEDPEILMGVILEASLPEPTDLQVQVREKGVAGRPGFTLDAIWQTQAGDPVTPEVRDGLVAETPGGWRRLSLGQHRVLRVLAEMAALGASREEDLRARFRVLGAIPPGDEGVRLDRFLARDEVVPVEQVAPRLVPVQGGYQVQPTGAGLPDDVLPDDVLADYYFGTPRSQLGEAPCTVVGEGGRRKRILFSERATAGMERCRDIDVMSPRQTAHALSHPEAVFGEDLDTSQLCERVVGVGPDVRRPTTFLKEMRRTDWFDWQIGVTLDRPGEQAEPVSSLDLKNPEVRASVQQAVMEADASQDAFIPHPAGKGFIEITAELRKALAAARRLEDASTDGKLDKSPRQVLLVSENLDDLVFDRGNLEAPPLPATVGRPPGLRDGAALMPHQREGFAWLQSIYAYEGQDRQRWRGSLLADDMGLGKTLQVLSFLAWLKDKPDSGPHLVVAPVALLENWAQEAERFFGRHLEPIQRFVGQDYAGVEPATIAKMLESRNLVLVSYETLRIHEFAFARVKWDTLILDEAQKAKNPKTQISRVVRALDARFRLAMSGTPVENTLRELWTLYDWAVPGLLGSLREFTQSYIVPAREAEHSQRIELAAKLQEVIRPVFLRRMKREIMADILPSIQWHDHEAPLSAAQQRRYAAAVAERQRDPRQALPMLAKLFGTCAHPHLPDGEKRLPSAQEVSYPKAEQLFALVDRIHARHEKVLVFIRWRKLQRWVAEELGRRYGTEVRIINGQVNQSRARLRIIEDFSNAPGFGALVLSARAAGVGLNITAANHVIHFTREWNPAIENQATDRAYRIGQDKAVHVHTITTTPATSAVDAGMPGSEMGMPGSEMGMPGSEMGMPGNEGSVKGSEGSSHQTVEQHLARLLREKRELMRDFTVPMGGTEVAPGDLLYQVG
jgi:superfamily II DNA or RNA helicase